MLYSCRALALRSIRSIARNSNFKVTTAHRYTPSHHFCQATPLEIETVDYFTLNHKDGEIQYGDYGLLASQGQPNKKFTDVSKIGTPEGPAMGETVLVRGRVSSVRAKGNACFLVLRSGSFYTLQVNMELMDHFLFLNISVNHTLI